MISTNKDHILTGSLLFFAIMLVGIALFRNYNDPDNRFAARMVEGDWWKYHGLSYRPESDMNGKHHVAIFFDYECPLCSKQNDAVDSLGSDKYRISYYHYPLPTHPNASKYAALGVCAEQLGMFQQFHDKMISADNRSASESIIDLLRSTGVQSPDEILDCYDNGRFNWTLNQHFVVAADLGIMGIPSILVDSTLYSGYHNTKFLLSSLDN